MMSPSMKVKNVGKTVHEQVDELGLHGLLSMAHRMTGLDKQ